MEVRQSILALLILFNLPLTLVYLTTWNSFVWQNFYWKHGNIVKLSCVNLEAVIAWEQASFRVAVGRLPRLCMLDKYWVNWSLEEWLINLSALSLFFLIKSHWVEEYTSSSVSFGLPAGTAASLTAHLAVGMLLCEGVGRQPGAAAPWQRSSAKGVVWGHLQGCWCQDPWPRHLLIWGLSDGGERGRASLSTTHLSPQDYSPVRASGAWGRATQGGSKWDEETNWINSIKRCGSSTKECISRWVLKETDLKKQNSR